MAIPLIAVYGTGGGDFSVDDAKCANGSHWWHPWSPWWTYMATLGFAPFRTDDFEWTGSLDGISLDRMWRWLAGQQATIRHRQWYAGGQALRDYVLDGIDAGQPKDRFVVVAHSHGGQVALYAACAKTVIPILITVSTPHRVDMAAVIERARPHIGFWVHLYDPACDLIGQAGAFGDGPVSFLRTQPRADLNLAVDDCSHSLELRDGSKYHVWHDAVLPRLAPQLAGWTHAA